MSVIFTAASTEVHRAQIQLGVDGQDPLRGEGYTGEQVQRKYGLWRRNPSLQEKQRRREETNARIPGE